MTARASDRRLRTAAPCAAAILMLVAGCASPGSASRSDAARAPKVSPDGSVFLDRVPDLKAIDSRGAISSLANLLTFWGRKTSVAEAHRLYDEFEPNWGDVAAMALVAREHGFWAHVGAGDQEQIKERVRAGVPVLIDLPIDTRKRNWRRLSLVVGFDDAQQRFLCHEGQGRPIRYTYEGLDRWWKHTRYWMMVICPPDRAAWSLRAEEYLSRGRYYESLNQLAEAEDDLDRAAEMNPSDSAVYVSLANVERKRGHRDEALAMYRKALDVREDDARAMNNLAYMLAEEDGGLAEAEALARNALLLEPTNPRTMDTLGVVQSRQGRHDKAAHFFEQAMARAGKLAAAERDEIAVHLAQAYRAGGRDAEAAKVVADLLRRNPDLRLPEDLRALHP